MDSGIYGLCDGDTGRIVYVGRGFDIDTRYRLHLREGAAEGWKSLSRGWLDYPVNRTKRNALAYLWLNASPVDLWMIESVGPERKIQEDREGYWAAVLAAANHPLANGTSAGTQLACGGRGVIPKPACPYTPQLELTVARSKRVIDVHSVPALRKLRSDAPALHARVLAGEISPHAAMIEAGFRKKSVTIKVDPESAARTIVRAFDRDQVSELIACLYDEMSGS